MSAAQTDNSLKVIRDKARRPVPAGEVGYLQPYPDRLLDQLAHVGADPAAVAERRESVALAFITALQRLPARQQAALILRDVLAWNAAEVAALLEISVPAVNSALQRARATLSGIRPTDSGTARLRLDDHQRQLLDRFTDAWQRCDIDALAAYLPDQSARCHGYGIMVFTTTSEGIAAITGFPSPGLFERFGLPSRTERP